MTRQLLGMPSGTLMARSAQATLDHPGALLGLADQLQTRAVQNLTVRAGEGEAGTFEGYACVWDVTDSYGTTFTRGCFRDGGLDSDPYALLWMHSPFDVLGTFTAVEDEVGLRVTGSWDDTPEGLTGRARAKSGSAPGLSVGFVPIMVDPDDETVFTQCRLVETSQITRRMASVPGAELDTVRMVGKADERRAAADRALALLNLGQRVR